MKKLIYTILAAAATLFAVSCARETEKAGLDNGDTVEAQFNLGFAGTLTKAYSDGLSATQLVVGVYDRQLGYLDGLSIAPDNADYKKAFAQLQTTYTARLVKGHGYDIVFLAVAPDNGIYTIDLEKGTFTVNPTGPSNEELRDAFYAVYSIDRVAAAIDQTITLTRPFAQINVISEKQDFEAAVAAKVDFGKSALKINAPSVLNLVDGSVAEFVDYDLTPAPMPVETGDTAAHPNFEPYRSKGDYWLMTDYVLVDPSGNDSEVNFTLYAKDSEEELFSYSIPNVALKQNYRTNIYGSVLTTDGHFTVVIEPEYFGELPAPVDGVVPDIQMYDSTLPSPSTGGLVKVEVGQTINFKAIHPVEGIVPEYSSSIEEVGTITKDGLFTGVADGKTIVTIYFPAVWNGVPTNDPGVVPGSDPGTEPGTGSEPGTDPGTGTDTEPGTDPGTEPGTDPGTTPSPNGEGTLASPFNAQGAYDCAAALATGETSEKDYYIKGKISSIKYTFDVQHGTATFDISADGTTTGTQFTCYSVYYLGNRAWAEGDKQVEVGNEVIVYGKLINYQGTPETASKKACLYSLNGTTAPAGVPAVKGDAAAVNYAARVIQYTVIVGNGAGETGEKGSADNPYTVAEALTVINGLEKGAKTENDVYVKGVITDIKEVNTDQYGNATYSIADSEESTDKIVVYRGYYLDGEKFTATDQIKLKDNVVVCGKLQKYVDKDDVMTPEVAQGNKIYSINGQGGTTPSDPNPPTGDGNYVKVTTAPEDWSGEYLIVYEDGAVAFNGGLTDKLDVAENGISVTISGGTIASSTAVDNATFTIAKMEGGYSVKSHSGIYISGKADTNTIVEGSEAVANTITLTDGNAVIASNSASIMYNSASNQLRFRFYKDGSNQKPVALYKKGDGGTTPSDQPATATISASDVTVEVGKTANINATTNSTAAIKYAVADATIATVDNGVVTGVKVGSTKVTLSVDAVEGKFTAASKEITVTVKEAGSQPAVQTVTVAQFNAAAENVDQKYQLTGTITKLTNSTYGNFTLKDNTGEVIVYGLTATEQEWDKENKKITNDKSFGSLNLKEGDTVTLIGYRIDYNNAPEVAGAYYVSSEAGDAITTITFRADASVQVGKELDIHATCNVSGATITYTTSDASIVTVTSAGVIKGIKAGTATVTASVAAVAGSHTADSKQCTVTVTNEAVTLGEFDSNVTFTAGTSAYVDNGLTVNETAVTTNLKLGTSSKYGDATFSIPAGTKTITFYGVGWKNITASLKFTVGSKTFTQVVAANDGATGNAPYTMTVTTSDKYTITLDSAVSAATEVKVETFEGDPDKGCRAIIFGVQAK